MNDVTARHLLYLKFSKKEILLEEEKKIVYSSQSVIQFYCILRLASIILYIPINIIEEWKGLTTLTSIKDTMVNYLHAQIVYINSINKKGVKTCIVFIYFLFINSYLKIIFVHTSETKYNNLLNT